MVDERHVGAEDLPGANLMAAVLGLEQSRTPKDVMGVAGLLAQWLRDPRAPSIPSKGLDRLRNSS